MSWHNFTCVETCLKWLSKTTKDLTGCRRWATWIFQVRSRNASPTKTTFDHGLKGVVCCYFDYFTALYHLVRSVTDKGREAQFMMQRIRDLRFLWRYKFGLMIFLFMTPLLFSKWKKFSRNVSDHPQDYTRHNLTNLFYIISKACRRRSSSPGTEPANLLGVRLDRFVRR